MVDLYWNPRGANFMCTRYGKLNSLELTSTHFNGEITTKRGENNRISNFRTARNPRNPNLPNRNRNLVASSQVFWMSLPLISQPANLIRLRLRMRRAVYPSRRLIVWSKRPKNTRVKTLQIVDESKRRMDWRTTGKENWFGFIGKRVLFWGGVLIWGEGFWFIGKVFIRYWKKRKKSTSSSNDFHPQKMIILNPQKTIPMIQKSPA